MKVPNKLGDDEGGEKLSVNLKFTKMDDFSPAAIARQVPAIAKLLEAREQLANLLRYMDGKVAAEDTLKKLLADPDTDGGDEGEARSEAVGRAARRRSRRQSKGQCTHGMTGTGMQQQRAAAARSWPRRTSSPRF